ncbi:MAG: hypothetical protein KF744_13670 [Taibaiella sp.]|nr:hypothetical protein [Taibaiella sp.]
MNNQRPFSWSIVALLFALGVVVLLFPSLVFHPSTTLPGVTSDGGKNIYSYLYHVLYESGTWTYSMNYPYGEHILYTDGQPLLSVTLGSIGGVSIGTALTVMWWTILLSYVLGVYYSFRTMVSFGVLPAISLVASGLIIICSPQLYRTLGHFGLSYVCVIPMCFWWTYRYHNSGSWRYMLFVALLGVIVSLLHPYFAALVFIWLALYGAVYFVTNRDNIPVRLKRLVPVGTAAVAVPGLFALFVKLTDHVKDRPTAPYGMLEYRTKLKDVLTSPMSPFWQFFRDHIHHVNLEEGREGYAYAGVVVLGAMLLAAMHALRKRAKRVASNENGDLRPWLLVALGGLVMSMVVPYISEVDWLYNNLSAFKQFRTMGRFSWIFYYIICVCGTVYTSRWFTVLRAKGRTVMAISLLAVSFTVWGAEAAVHVVTIRQRFSDAQKHYDELAGNVGYSWGKFLAGKEYNPRQFQALLILPFFEVGTDKIWFDRSIIHHSIKGAATAGLQLHLPLIDAMMARSSWSQIFKQVKIAGGPYVHKPVLDEIKDDKPFLLLNLDYSELDPDQQYLVNASDPIGNFLEWRVSACYPARIREADRKNHDSVLKMTTSLPDGDTSIGSNSTYFYEHFDTGKSATPFYGGGAMLMQPQGLMKVAEIPVHAGENELYEFSLWFLLEKGTYRSPVCRIKLMDATGKEVGSAESLVKESTDNEGMWFRGYSWFRMPAGCARVQVWIDNDNLSSYLEADELLLRPANSLILSKRDGRIMADNHVIE